MIYFDNSATTFPKPESVVKAVQEAVLHYGGNPGRGGHEYAMRISEKVFSVRVKLAEMFGVLPEHVVFCENCTMALNFAIHAIPDGADVITTDLEHNAVIRPLHAAQKQGKLHYRILPTGKDNRGLLQTLDRMRKADTKAVVMTAASNVTGRVLPIHEVGAYCKEHGLIFIVDAAQAAGVIPIDCKADGIDLLCMSGHKGLYGIAGTGILLSSGRVPLKLLIYGGTGTRSLELQQKNELPEGMEAGTLPTVGICALDAGLDYLDQNGIAMLSAKSLHLCLLLYRALKQMPQVKVYSPKPQMGETVPIVAFSIDSIPSESAAASLSQMGFALRGGYQCAAVTHYKLGTVSTGVIRFSPGGFNSPKEVQMLIDAIRKIIEKNEKKG